MSCQGIYENKSASSIFPISKLKMRANQAIRNRYILIKRPSGSCNFIRNEMKYTKVFGFGTFL